MYVYIYYTFEYTTRLLLPNIKNVGSQTLFQVRGIRICIYIYKYIYIYRDRHRYRYR